MNTAGLIDALQFAILPVMAFPLIGFVMGRRAMFSTDAARGANAYVITLALPSMLFMVLARANLAEIEPQVLLVYLGSEVGLYALTFALMRRVFARPRREAALIGLVSCFPNHVFLSLPIAEALYGAQGAGVIATLVAFDVVFIFGGTIIFLEGLRGEKTLSGTILDIASNRLLLALWAGIAWNLSGFEFHEGVERFLVMAGASATPTALFALGVMLSAADLRVIGAPVWWATAIKMVLHPAIALVLIGLFGPVSEIWRSASLLAFAAPGGAMAFVLGLRYDVDIDIIIKVILISTALSVISFAVLA